MNPITESASSLMKQKIEAVSVFIGEKNRLTAVAAEDYVVESTGHVYARFSCHVTIYSFILLTCQLGSLTQEGGENIQFRWEYGGRTWDRTKDLPIKSRLLYQLSYAPVLWIITITAIQ